MFVEYYEELLGEKLENRMQAVENIPEMGPILLVQQQIELLRPFADKELKDAMFHIDSNKSPGPDGFGSGFYKAAWSIVGQDIIEAVLERFSKWEDAETNQLN